MKRLVLLAFLSVACGRADVISPDGTWYEFRATVLNGAAMGCQGGCFASSYAIPIQFTTTTPWTWTGPATLTVLDLFLSGDQYEVFDNGTSLGLTSSPATGPNFQCGGVIDPDIACSLNDPRFSRGVYTLGPGDHSISVNYIQTTFVGHSGAGLQLSPAPEPGTVALSIFGLLSLLAFKIGAFATARSNPNTTI